VARVHIVTDSDAQLDADTAQRLGVTVMPITVKVGEEFYQDIEGRYNEELLLRMKAERVVPEIVGPTEAEFRTLFSRLSRTTNQIVAIHSSGCLSNIIRNARNAALEFLGRCDIVIVDSQSTSLGLSILVREAATMALGGANREEILRYVRGMIHRIYVVMFTESLDYLERSGRISPAQCILGTMLDIRPFLSIEDGEIIPMEKVRSREKGLDKLAEFIGEFSSIETAAILQSTSAVTDETANLRERLQGFFPDKEFPIVVYGPLLAARVGPDGLGLVTYEGMGEQESP